MSGTDCVFCAILAGRAPAAVVHANADTLAFMDRRQAVPGHVLVVPRRHVATLPELAEEEGAALMRVAVRIARALARVWPAPGLNLWQSNGEAGGQEVDHVHLHLHPRRVGDGLLRVYPRGLPRPTPTTELERLAAPLRAALGDPDRR